VRLRIDATRASAGTIGDLRSVICDYPGESQVFIDCVTSEGTKVYRFGAKYRVQAVPDFYAEVRALLGEASLA
jgi:hypothetical protein